MMIADKLYSKSLFAVLIAQFFSAFSDNALLFATLALIKYYLYPDWSQPILQMVFVFAYILLAPFVGQFADRYAKAQVMMVANSIKVIGSFIICINLSPFFGYALVGLGAAAYSPAKYGILSEITTEKYLVKANGLMEASTIIAILSGALVSGFVADYNITAALLISVSGYLIAVIANIFIPSTQIQKTSMPMFNLWHWLYDFWRNSLILCKNRQSLFSLLGSSLFWGVGITLRFLLIIWVPVALKIKDNFTPTLLNAIVAIGIVIGAGVAAKKITLSNVYKCLPLAILMGGVVILLAYQHNIYISYCLLVLIGVLGGICIVPFNALLQSVGHKTIGTGNAVAIQNLFENSAMLMMLGIYSLTLSLNMPVVSIVVFFGGLVSLLYALLWWKNRHAISVN